MNYLKSSLGINININVVMKDISHGYTNVDWARGWDTCHSTLSNYFILMNGVIS
jgi:hypothetical protein